MAKIKCNCQGKAAEWQGKEYGKGVRIATPKLKVQGRTPEYTCTVCGTKTTNLVSE